MGRLRFRSLSHLVLEGSHHLLAVEVPYLDGAVVAARHRQPPVGRHVAAAHPVLVPRQRERKLLGGHGPDLWGKAASIGGPSASVSKAMWGRWLGLLGCCLAPCG